MRLDLSAVLQARLPAVFPDVADKNRAVESLNRYQESDGPAVYAVRLAVLKLCDGKIWKLRELMEKARHDFRDVLYPAQIDQASWHAWITAPNQP